ncbi:MAG: hypothetical protein J0G33_02715 [Afipia felis]|nr:hypothetical protein [Afipia felis]
MTDTTSAPGGEGAASAAPVEVTPAATSQEPMSAEQAADYLSELRKPKQQAESAEDPATAETNSAEEAEEPAPAEEQPSGEEEPEAADPEAEELPPIEPPRSWTKDEQERFKSYPRELQAYLSEREQQRDRELRRSQNEAAEQRKVITAEREQAEKARKDYEARLPAVVQALQEIQNSQFPDIRTMADVERMALEDPFRKIQWDTHQQKMQAVAYEAEQARIHQQQEQSTNWSKFQAEESAKAAEMHPELADPKKAEALGKSAKDLLVDKGFTESELGGLASGEKISPFDHRMQSIILDAIKYREAQKAKPVAVAKPVPPVQRPGVAPPRGAAKAENLQALKQQLDRSGSVDDALALLAARRKAS